MAPSQRRRTSERGQALVEFALIANLLAVLLLAILQFGEAFAHKIEVTDAARSAARAASTYGGDVTPSTALRDAAELAGNHAATDSTSVSGETVTWTIQNNSWIAGNQITATVAAPARISILGVTVWSGNLQSSTTMRIEKRGLR